MVENEFVSLKTFKKIADRITQEKCEKLRGFNKENKFKKKSI